MSEANAFPNMTENGNGAGLSPASALDWGVGPLLAAQADLIAGAETTVTDWLHRRHEAIDDTKRLIASIRTGADLGEALKAQQEFLSRSFRRLAADADAYHTAAQQMLDRSPAWFPHAWFVRAAEISHGQVAETTQPEWR